MKNSMKKWATLSAALAAAFMLSTAAQAAETISFNGYEGESANPAITAEYQVSLSGVERVEADMHEGLGDVYVCKAPFKVTALDTLSGFGVSTMVPMMDTYIEGEYLVPDGYTQEQMWSGSVTSFPKGTTFTVTQPGLYYLYGNYEGVIGGVNVVFLVEGNASQPETPAPMQALPTSSKVLVNGEVVAFDAYNIGGNNYFKLRDVAMALRGTEKQFEVTWDGEKNAINLISGEAYTVAGGELAAGDGQAKSALPSTSVIYQDGEQVSLMAFNIGGNNYFKLRDLGRAFDFGVGWDAASNSVSINTAEGYVEA